MARFKVALVGNDSLGTPDWVIEAFEKEEGIEFVEYECKTREDLEQYAQDADVAWTFGGSKCLKNGNLSALKKCWAIVRTGSGTDNIPVAEATERGIIVANTPEAINNSVAEHAIGLLFSVIRQTAIHDRLIRNGVWDRMRAWPNWHLVGQTFGLVGFGLVARTVVKRMSNFEMKFLAFDPYVDEAQMAALGVRKVELDELLAASDYVSLHCPLTEGTRHLIGEKQLKQMKPTAVLINTSRGPVVDEKELIRALSEGWISAVGSDVMEIEPPDPDHPLLKMENFVITPHVSGYSDIYYDSMWRYSADTVIDFYHGRMPRSYVNPQVKPIKDLKPRTS